MSDAKHDEPGQELDFDIFSAPVPETLPRPSWRSRQKAGVKGVYKADAAVADIPLPTIAAMEAAGFVERLRCDGELVMVTDGWAEIAKR